MADSARAFLEDVLNRVEEREAGLLVWGVVDGFFVTTELASIIDPLIDAAILAGRRDFLDAADVIEELVNRKWMVEVEGSGGETRYRSRMAETMRLLLRLRQLFPKHARTEFGWQEAPTLVADFRFQRRRRQYPRRGVLTDEVLAQLRQATDNPIILRGVEALIKSSTSLHESGLARFQVRAAERILRAIESGKALATIICAGTSSGKTLAFYLPALASVMRHRIGDRAGPAWVKVVAIYPRSELLKDQLGEVLARVLALRDYVGGDPKLAISVGALYGDTPSSTQSCFWPKSGTDRICPVLRCIRCKGELRWAEEDYRRGRERLICRNASCEFSIDDSVFPLTRESLAKRPPDVLFSTTEMLNQRLADNNLAHLFGVGTRVPRPPELVLLDEVHIYEGRHGAQVAYLMRRWQRLVEQPLRFVGLSATLREASTFFSSLIGAWPNVIEEISPKSDELVSEGAEYLVALRGDPVSRAALLSTTIQSAMLIQRCLDVKTSDPGESLSNGVFGQRTFVFTDNLDVTNRLYFNLLDAEGRDSFGRPDIRSAPTGGLAYLRRTGVSRLRYYGGQDWRMCESLGHELSTRLRIERVSSQDRGIDAAADIVVATAALEVGFDDPTVGAVIQHKAPVGMAGYLQRKGRAGRSRGMRPWMVVVLSDYGRDRLAYQNYDLLFDPELSVRTLPLSNRYVTRMQAVYASIDYLGERLQNAPQGSVWRDLTGPPKNDGRAARLIKELRRVLETESGTRQLTDYLRAAMKMSDEEISALMWEYPRPLMTTVLPTALRRLASNWRAGGKRNQDFQIRNNPLPEFIPASLFADLNLAEVRIDLPRAVHEQQSELAMPLFAALREFAPGRVSRRFGIRHRGERYWLPPPSDALTNGVPGELGLGEVGQMLKVGDFLRAHEGIAASIPVYRPLSIEPKTPPPNVGDTSNARLIWHTQLLPLGEPDWLSLPPESVWNKIVQRVGFFLHASNVPVEVRRFSTGSIAEIGIGKGDRRRVTVKFAVEGQPAAIGAAFAADGVVFQVVLPDRLYARDSANATKWRALRTGRFMDDAWRGVSLSSVHSPFLRDWLAQIHLSAITYEAVQRQVSLDVAASAVAAGTATISPVGVLAVLFQSQVVDVEDEELQLGGQDRLRGELETLLHDETVQQELRQAANRLWEPVTEEWEPWLRLVYHGTLACALLRALCDLCPTIDVADLVVDLQRGPIGNEGMASPEPGSVEIWITEQGPGGNGLIEEFMHRYAEDPRRFFSMVRAVLEMGEFELIDHQIARLLDVLLAKQGESNTRNIVSRMRSAANHGELSQLAKELRVALVREGFSPFHGFIVSLANRLLRPGAGPATDTYLASTLSRWKAEEQRLGVEIDLRVVCYWLSQLPDIDAVAAEVGIPEGNDLGAWRMSAIYGLLWARGRAIREAALQIRSPFIELPLVERLLVIETISDEGTRVSVEDPNWLDTSAALLTKGHLVTLTCSEHRRAHLGRALDALICNPVESGYLRAYARLQGVRQTAGVIEADIELVEAIQ